MSTPHKYLPTCSTDDIKELFKHLQFPQPKNIKILETVAADFHKIWTVTFTENFFAQAIYSDPNRGTQPQNKDEIELILRVSGNHMPKVKTENEVAVLHWLRSTGTSIPVPSTLAYDITSNNPLGQEFMLMTKLPGVTGSDIYQELTTEQLDVILDQLVEYHLELYSKPFEHVGGLRMSPLDTTLPGPVLDENLWQVPEIEKYWPEGESFASLNPDSPNGYPTFVAWCTAYVLKYIHGVNIHPSLSWLSHEDIAMLERYLEIINSSTMLEKLNGGLRYILAHCDLHFGNMLLSPETRHITGIIDWEFAQVVALPLWRRSFLWKGRKDSTSGAEREQLYALWEIKMKQSKQGRQFLADTKWKCEEQKWAWDVCNYLRCVVEVCPRGEEHKPYKAWWGNCITAMRNLGL